MSEQELHTRDTIEFVGFDSATAQSIWDRWTSMPSSIQCLHPFTTFLTAHVESKGWDAECESDDYRACFEAYGLEQSLIDRLTDSRYLQIRTTQSASHWAREIIESRYEILEDSQEASPVGQTQGNAGARVSRAPSHQIASGSGAALPSVSDEPEYTSFWKATTKTKARRMKTRAEAPGKLLSNS